MAHDVFESREPRSFRELLHAIYKIVRDIRTLTIDNTMTLDQILQKEDETAAEVGKLVTAFQSTSAEVGTLQAEVAALQAGTVTDAQLQAVADKLDAIKTAADAAIPATPVG